MKPEALVRWTRENAIDLYGVRNWGLGFFDVSNGGDVVVKPGGMAGEASLNIIELVRELKAKGLNVPVLIRFADILASRIAELYDCFNKAISDYGYKGEYRGVYPVKVNHQKEVVTAVVEVGSQYHHGLEVGSKAELLSAIAYTIDSEALIVCNGYKDSEYIDLALYALKMGLRVVIVIEMADELSSILTRAALIGVRPTLGVRVKLSSRGGGKWDGSGGDRSMFGVNASQIITIIDHLRSSCMLDCLKMLHYHLGSQIANIRNIRSALTEACRFYVEMKREGAAMGMINIGGGLAVDYDGSHTNFPSSRNYTEQEYAADVVEVLVNVFNEADIPHPMIVSESGRATVAHHSVLIFNVLDVARFEPGTLPKDMLPEEHPMLGNLIDVRNSLSPKNLQECYHDAVYYRDEIRNLFLHGDLTLRERSLGESLFWDIICKIAAGTKSHKYVPDELHGLDNALADLYYGNFSVFQSLPDSWAIDHLFPIMPIHRLCEMPLRQATIADITCDSDGKINRFIDLHDVKHTLPVHDLKGEEYYMGAFLVGAYQETLGDFHNLLGDTNVLHVRIGKDGKAEHIAEIAGDTVADVLSVVEYDPADMVNRFQLISEQAVKAGRISSEEQYKIMIDFEDGMRGYTYFES